MPKYLRKSCGTEAGRHLHQFECHYLVQVQPSLVNVEWDMTLLIVEEAAYQLFYSNVNASDQREIATHSDKDVYTFVEIGV